MYGEGKSSLSFGVFCGGAAQLSAGGVDVGTQLAAYGCANAALLQRPCKGAHGSLARADKAGFIHLVDGDEVDVNGNGVGSRAQAAVQAPCQLFGLLDRVVLA